MCAKSTAASPPFTCAVTSWHHGQSSWGLRDISYRRQVRRILPACRQQLCLVLSLCMSQDVELLSSKVFPFAGGLSLLTPWELAGFVLPQEQVWRSSDALTGTYQSENCRPTLIVLITVTKGSRMGYECCRVRTRTAQAILLF